MSDDMSNDSKIVVYIPKEWQSMAVNDSVEMTSVVPRLSSPPASSSAAGSGAAGAGLPGNSRRTNVNAVPSCAVSASPAYSACR